MRRDSAPVGATTTSARGGRVLSEGHGCACSFDERDVARLIEAELWCVKRHQ